MTHVIYLCAPLLAYILFLSRGNNYLESCVIPLLLLFFFFIIWIYDSVWTSLPPARANYNISLLQILTVLYDKFKLICIQDIHSVAPLAYLVSTSSTLPDHNKHSICFYNSACWFSASTALLHTSVVHSFYCWVVFHCV